MMKRGSTRGAVLVAMLCSLVLLGLALTRAAGPDPLLAACDEWTRASVRDPSVEPGTRAERLRRALASAEIAADANSAFGPLRDRIRDTAERSETAGHAALPMTDTQVGGLMASVVGLCTAAGQRP